MTELTELVLVAVAMVRASLPEAHSNLRDATGVPAALLEKGDEEQNALLADLDRGELRVVAVMLAGMAAMALAEQGEEEPRSCWRT